MKNLHITNLALVQQLSKASSPIDLNERRKKLANEAIPLNKPYLPAFSKYKKYLSRMYDNVWLTNNGPLVKELTSRLESFLGVKNLLLTSSGTIALQVAFRALKLSGNVVTTPYSFVATSNSLDWLGLTPNFADIDRRTFNLCPQNAERAINEKTTAIVPVHVYGNPCDVNALATIAKRHQLKLIYDAAHAFNVKVGGQSVLNFGDASVLSLHATKLFHSVEGGALILNNDDDFEIASQMINFGINSLNGAIAHQGTNGKMSEAHAAMGLAMLDDIDMILSRRLEHYQTYQSLLQNDVCFPEWHPDATQNAAYFPVMFRTSAICTQVFDRLNQHNIQSRRYFSPSLNTVEHYNINGKMVCAESESAAQRTLCMPLFVDLKKTEIARVCRVINSIINEKR